jgi:hypothetical protein
MEKGYRLQPVCFLFCFFFYLFSLSRSSFPKNPYFLSIFFLFLSPSAVRIHTAGIMFFILLRFLQLVTSHSASGTDLSFFIFFSFKSSRVFNLFYYYFFCDKNSGFFFFLSLHLGCALQIFDGFSIKLFLSLVYAQTH